MARNVQITRSIINDFFGPGRHGNADAGYRREIRMAIKKTMRAETRREIEEALSGEAPQELSAFDRKLDRLIGPGDASIAMPGTLFVDADNNFIAFCSRSSRPTLADLRKMYPQDRFDDRAEIMLNAFNHSRL